MNKNDYDAIMSLLQTPKEEMSKKHQNDVYFLVNVSMGGMVADPRIIPVNVHNHREND